MTSNKAEIHPAYSAPTECRPLAVFKEPTSKVSKGREGKGERTGEEEEWDSGFRPGRL